MIGDPTEAALVAAAASHGLSKGRLDRLFPLLIHSPYSTAGSRASSLHDIRLTPHSGPVEEPLLKAVGKDSSGLVTCLGSIQNVLDASEQVWINGDIQPLDDAARAAAREQARQLEQAGMRSLAVGMRPLHRMPALVEDFPHPLRSLPSPFRDLPSAPGDIPRSVEAGDELERELILVGYIGVHDPPRTGVLQAIQDWRAAGIRLAMICEDRPPEAIQVARSLDLHHGNPVPRVLSGREMQRLSQAELDRIVERIDVFSQLSPAQRLMVIRALQRRGQAVAVTGAGVNDYAAMRTSSLGIALKNGKTELTRASADLVLEENSISAIFKATVEGHQVSRDLQRAIRWMLAGSLPVAGILLAAALLGIHPVLAPLQVMWLSLICGGVPALGAAAPARPGNQVQPRKPVRRNTWAHLTAVSLLPVSLVAAVDLAFAAWAYTGGSAGWRTLVFSLLAFQMAGGGLLAVTGKHSWAAGLAAVLIQLAIIYWPPAQALFGTQALPPAGLAITLLVGTAAAAAWKMIDQPAARKGF